MLEITARTSDLGEDNQFGGRHQTGNAVAKGTCSFCSNKAAFRQVGTYEEGEKLGFAVAVRCDGCHSIMVISYSDGEATLYPTQNIEGITEVPDPIDSYYREALDCLSVGAPNGAVTLFRKTIHAIAIHYDLAEVDESMRIYDMVNELHEAGEINEKLRRSLLAVKDLGNDGAHINKNEPDMSQALAIKDLIDAVLSATIIVDQQIGYARQNHPNEFAIDDEPE